MRAPGHLLVAALSLMSGGCWLGAPKATPKIPVPPAAVPRPAVAESPSQPVAQPEPAPPPPVVPEAKPAVKPAPPPQSVVRRPIPAGPAPPPPAPVPQLREVISGDQRRQYDAEFVQGVGRAGAALREASTHTLTAAQRETVSRIRTFLDQAAAARDTDISTALQLARRADLLGQELLKTLK